MVVATSKRACAVEGDGGVGLQSARLLYVDDQQDEADLFLSTMRRLGLHADACCSASEALQLASQHRYSIFALDVCMPDMDGDALACELWRTNPKASFLLVTGLTDVNLPKRSEDHPPISGVIAKPWDTNLLLAALTRGQAAYEDRAANASLRPSSKSDRPLPVLLVEDDDDDAQRVEALLRRSDLTGLELVRAARLRDAIRLVGEREFGAIVSELALPDARGLDAVLQYGAVCPHVPVVVLSTVSDEALALQAVQEGAQEYLLKADLTIATLQRTIRRAVGRKAAAEGLEQRAERDALTGLLGRATFESRLRGMLRQAQVDGMRLCLLYLDLDRFKQVNDELGHAAGDEVLREAAERLRGSLRPSDLAVRMGGDEFVVAVELGGHDEDALGLAQRIARELAQPYAAAPGVAVSASVGMAFYPDDAQTADELLERADHAMYRVKRRTGDDVGMFSEQTREMAVLDEDPDQAVKRRIMQGPLSAVPHALCDVGGRAGKLTELEPAWTRAHGEVDAATLRRVAATAALAAPLHRHLLRAAVDRCAERAERLLVTLSEPYCASDGAIAHVLACLSACPPRRLSIGLPQAWLAEDLERARATIADIARAGGEAYVTDYGADTLDLAFLHRLPGLRGVCLDGGRLRELSVHPGYLDVVVEALRRCTDALDLECRVRDADQGLLESDRPTSLGI